jgi:Zn-dependent protease with chaperone function
MDTRIAYAPPSAFKRAALSLALLVGFYLVLIGTATVLFVTPIAASVLKASLGLRLLFLFVVCWVPAGLLVASALKAKRPPFVTPGRRLGKEDAPALFEAVTELASRAGTAPPTEVYLDWMPNLAVTEAGSVFAPRRVLIVGAPLFNLLSVDELRAGIAHELGHFIGGDTRLTTFSCQTHALFASVLTTLERNPFKAGTQHAFIEIGLWLAQGLGGIIVRVYGSLFLRLTRPISRRQELVADALSAALLNGRIAGSALEKISVCAPLYERYLQEEVVFALRQGAMPTDLTAGFDRLRSHFLASEMGRRFVETVRAAETDRYDTHPALADRLRALDEESGSVLHPDDRSASALLPPDSVVDAWLVQTTRERLIAALQASDVTVRAVRELPWVQIAQDVYAPAAREAARRAAERLYPFLPGATTLSGMFVNAWRRMEVAGPLELVSRLEPALARLTPDDAQRAAIRIGAGLLGALLQGALLEQGAVAEESLGESLLLRLGEERVNVAETLALLGRQPEEGQAALNRWAARFESQP